MQFVARLRRCAAKFIHFCRAPTADRSSFAENFAGRPLQNRVILQLKIDPVLHSKIFFREHVSFAKLRPIQLFEWVHFRPDGVFVD
jgi:hypothetical protein